MSTNDSKDAPVYTPPAVEKVGSDADDASVVSTVPTKQAPAAPVVKTADAPKAAEPTLAPIPDVIGVGKMLNAKGTLVTADMIARIDRHMKFLRGDEGFASTKERDDEMISFIETIGNSIKQDFEGYVVVTDYLLEQIRENQKVFTGGTAFRFLQGISKGAYRDNVVNYQSYVELLTKFAVNWNVRYKLKKLVDITYAVKTLPKQGQINLTQYFNKLSSV